MWQPHHALSAPFSSLRPKRHLGPPTHPPLPTPPLPTPAGNKVGKPSSLEVDVVIGADGANSRVAKEIDAGEFDYAIAFQERIRIPEDKMEYYKDLAEMWVLLPSCSAG